MTENTIEKMAGRALPVSLLFVGVKSTHEFSSSSHVFGRSARLALFTFRAKNLSDRMDDAGQVKSQLYDAFAKIDSRKESVAEVVRYGSALVSIFKNLNNQAFNIGALSKDAFNVLDAVTDETMARIAQFMPDSMNKAQKIFLSTLESTKISSGHGVVQLKQLCFEMELLTEFWRNKVVRKVDVTLESIQQHNADILNCSTRQQFNKN